MLRLLLVAGVGVVALGDRTLDPPGDDIEGRAVLAYEGNGAAKKAWRAMVEQTRKLMGAAAERKAPRAGDESVVFAGTMGSLVTMRIGSVVAQAVTHFGGGYLTGNQAGEVKDPIEMSVKVQAEKIEEAL